MKELIVLVTIALLCASALAAESTTIYVNGVPQQATLATSSPTGAAVAGVPNVPDVGDVPSVGDVPDVTTAVPTLYDGADVSAGAEGVDVRTNHSTITTGATGVAVSHDGVEVNQQINARGEVVGTTPGVSVGPNGVHTPGVVVTPGEVRITPALVRSQFTQENINLDNIKAELEGQSVDITPGLIKSGDVNVGGGNKTVSVTINGGNINIIAGDTQVTITDGDITVNTPGVRIENGSVMVGDIEIKRPGEVIMPGLRVKAKNVTLETEAGKPVYKVQTHENKHLLWFVPVTVDGQVNIDAQNGSTISTDMPWWNFLAS